MTLKDKQKPENKQSTFTYIFAVLFWLGILALMLLSGMRSPTLNVENIVPFYISFLSFVYLLVIYASVIRKEIPIVLILNRLDTYRGNVAIALGLAYIVIITIFAFVFWP